MIVVVIVVILVERENPVRRRDVVSGIVVVVRCLSPGARGRVRGAKGESRWSSRRRLPAASSLTIVSFFPMRLMSKTGSGGRIPIVVSMLFSGGVIVIVVVGEVEDGEQR